MSLMYAFRSEFLARHILPMQYVKFYTIFYKKIFNLSIHIEFYFVNRTGSRNLITCIALFFYFQLFCNDDLMMTL
jgi:hypothetical protein